MLLGVSSHLNSFIISCLNQITRLTQDMTTLSPLSKHQLGLPFLLPSTIAFPLASPSPLRLYWWLPLRLPHLPRQIKSIVVVHMFFFFV